MQWKIHRSKCSRLRWKFRDSYFFSQFSFSQENSENSAIAQASEETWFLRCKSVNDLNLINLEGMFVEIQNSSHKKASFRQWNNPSEENCRRLRTDGWDGWGREKKDWKFIFRGDEKREITQWMLRSENNCFDSDVKPWKWISSKWSCIRWGLQTKKQQKKN